MGEARSSRRRAVRFLAALMTVVTSAGLALVTSSAAADPDLGSATQRAAQLRAEVEKLRIQAALAVEEYDAAQEQLGDLTTRSLLAGRQLDDARRRAQEHRGVAQQRARSLYISGGQLALYSTVLDAESLSDIAARLHNVRAFMAADRQVEDDDSDFVAEAARIDADLRSITDSYRSVEQSSAAAADRVRELLAAQQQALDAADIEVRMLLQRQQNLVDREAARRAKDELAAAIGRELADGYQASASSAAALAAISAAHTQLGKPYEWGATGPDSFDCSGLTRWAYAQAGVALPRTSREQWYAGIRIPLGLITPGDLLFWATNTADPSTIHHVAIYLGDASMLAAPHTGAVVRIEPLRLDGFIGAVRPR
jgi:cell wall-associated NlpC family hydrolase